VRLIKERGVSYVRASQDLGVHVSQLRDWVPMQTCPRRGRFVFNFAFLCMKAADMA
jgi:transposase-like protein